MSPPCFGSARICLRLLKAIGGVGKTRAVWWRDSGFASFSSIGGRGASWRLRRRAWGRRWGCLSWGGRPEQGKAVLFRGLQIHRLWPCDAKTPWQDSDDVRISREGPVGDLRIAQCGSTATALEPPRKCAAVAGGKRRRITVQNSAILASCCRQPPRGLPVHGSPRLAGQAKATPSGVVDLATDDWPHAP